MESLKPAARRQNPITFLAAIPIDPSMSFYTNPGAILTWITVDLRTARILVDPDAYDPSTTRKLSYARTILGDACCGVFCVVDTIFAALWNPYTREVLNVEFDMRGLSTSFKSATYIGFGPVKDAEGKVVDFKLLIMLNIDDAAGRIKRFLVYSLRDRSWTSVSHPSFTVDDVYQNGGIYLNGVIHWLAQAAAGASSYILTFDLARHVFGQINLPYANCQMLDIQDTTKNFISVFDYKHLQFGMVRPGEYLHLWVICEKGGSWVRRELVGPLVEARLMLRYFDSIGGVVVTSQADVNGRFWFHVEGNASTRSVGVNGRSKWYQYSESNVSLKGIANQQQEEMPEIINQSTTTTTGSTIQQHLS